LEYTIYGIKRGWVISRTFAFAGAFAALLVNGVFSLAPLGGSAQYIAMFMFLAWSVIFSFKLHARFFRSKLSESVAQRSELELGLMLIVAVHGAIQILGGLSSPYYPILLILLAFLVVYTNQWIGFTLVSFAVALEFAIVGFAPLESAYSYALLHSVFIALFSLINLIFTRTEIRRMRLKAMSRIEQVKTQFANDARAFRLTSAVNKPRGANAIEEEHERLSRCTVAEVRRSMYHHINLLKQTLKLNTCILFWSSDDGRQLNILECVTDSEVIDQRKFRIKEGVMGAVFQSGNRVLLKELRPGHPGLVYYAEPTLVTDFMGLPIKEGNSVRGILCADRTNHESFTTKEQEILATSVESILQNVTNERVFVQLQKAKSEQGRLLMASETLAKALNLKDVVSSSLEAAALIAPYDMAAVTLKGKTGKQRIIDVKGEGIELLSNLEMGLTKGLAGSVYKTGHFLPYRGNFDSSNQVVYTKEAQDAFTDMHSLLVMPLSSGDEILGTLMIASKNRGVYTEELRTTLQVMINQLGTKLENAQMVQKLKDLATTDGLTGLPNRRSFEDELTRQLAHSSRFNSPTSLIMCDVDKFKGVNDTYGHQVGDDVLKALGKTLKNIVVRDTDMPARYGGEEFIIICGGTDTEGAVQLGERVRRELEKQVFNTEKGPLSCTISMGVATYPEHAHNKEDLMERSDAALYAAKENGRNQVKIWKKGMTSS
ncbi:MAG: diguanylate cyclase, partial [Deltaproteobacteria bacterium]|nr:diguanylate cyclase [Deltaproteobacteria bacterium]